MSETVWKPHVTVATVVPADGRFLMVEETVRGRRVLNQPAGHLEPHEYLVTAAERETLEETGYRVAITDLIGIYQWVSPRGKQFLRIAFCADVIDHNPEAPLDEGIIGPIWMTVDEMQTENGRIRSPMVLRSIQDYLAGHRFPLDLINFLD